MRLLDHEFFERMRGGRPCAKLDAMPFALGLRLLDRYVLEEEIGHGGMSRVFKARDERSGKIVAVKQMVIDDEESVDTFRAWFKREIKALMVLDHPGVPRLLDHSGDGDGDPFVVLEYLNGFDLDMAIASHGAMPEAAAVLVAVKLLHALANAHENGIIHRDIKPANMFLCFNGRVVLLDFGLARATSQERGRTLAGTLNTKLIGTPQYFSPEQISGGVTLSAASDLYSLGASLYFLLSGKHAFVGDGPLAVIKAIGMNQRRPLAQAAHWLRPETVAFVEQLMAFEADARPKSAQTAMTNAEALLRFFPDSEALLRRYVAALERNEKPPAPQVGATMDVSAIERRDTQPDPPRLEPDTPTPVTRDDQTVVSAPSSQTMIVTAGGRTNVITSPAKATASTKRTGLYVAMAAGIVIVAGVAVALRPKKVKPPVTVVAEPPPPDPTSPPDTLPPPTAAEAVPAVPKIVEPEDTRPRTGTLSLQLKQWAEVIVDGKSYGRKQIMASFTLAEGAHEVELKNDRYGARQKKIAIKRGQEVTLQVDFVKQLP